MGTGARPYLLRRSARIERHMHASPYATVVLSGGYEEAGDAGRYRVAAGAVLFHGAFSAHCDVTGAAPTRVIDLPLAIDADWPAHGRVADADAIVRAAERDPREGAALLQAAFEPVTVLAQELPDRLAEALCGDARIGDWAADEGRSREWVSRQFRRLYGVGAARYRAEARARRAWRLIVTTPASLAEIAFASGHADQAHMTRAVRALTGAPPSAWRSHPFKTGGSPGR